MKKIVTLGEIMLRLSPQGRDRILGANSFDVNYGGGEANVAAALAQFGIEAKFVSKLPDNELGDSAIKHLRGLGVDTSAVVRGGERIGIYYLENGFSVRNSMVVYDRAGSSFATATVEDFNIDEILKGYDMLLVSGITLGLSEDGFKIGKAFMERAKELGMEVAFDSNYRAKLWTLEEAGAKITQIIGLVDIFFAGHLDFRNILGFTPNKDEETDGILPYYQDLYEQVIAKYSNLKYIVSSARTVKSASKNIYNGMIFNSSTKEILTSKKYDLDIVDRVGTGDSYTAGSLYGFAAGKSAQYTVDFAASSAALKHTIAGDANLVKVKEVEALFKSNSFDVAR